MDDRSGKPAHLRNLEEIFDAAYNEIVVINLEGKILIYNKAAGRKLKIDANTVKGRFIGEAISKEVWAQSIQGIRAIKGNGGNPTFLFIFKFHFYSPPLVIYGSGILFLFCSIPSEILSVICHSLKISADRSHKSGSDCLTISVPISNALRLRSSLLEGRLSKITVLKSSRSMGSSHT